MWHPGHVAKAKKRMAELLKAVNTVLEIRDARAPFATGAYDRRTLLRGKRTIIILNKADLADENVTKKWLDYFLDRGERVVLSQKWERSRSVLRKLFSQNMDLRILVVGLPNVGKSSFINRMKGRRSLKVGAVPGITRGVQWIQVDEKIKVLDTPGIIYTELFSKRLMAKLLLVGVLTAEILDDWKVFEMAFEILKNRYPGIIRERLGEAENLQEALQKFGRNLGLVRKGGIVDESTALQRMFYDISMGKWGRMSFEDPDEIHVEDDTQRGW